MTASKAEKAGDIAGCVIAALLLTLLEVATVTAFMWAGLRGLHFRAPILPLAALIAAMILLLRFGVRGRSS